MSEVKGRLDLYLTEISIELLGNKFYDVNGTRQNQMISLFKALPEDKRNVQKNVNNNDFLCSLGYRMDFTETGPSVKEFLNEQLDFILEDANTSQNVNQDVITCLRDYKRDQSKLLEDVAELDLKKVIEKNKIANQLNIEREKVATRNIPRDDKIQEINEYHEREKNVLLKMNMDTLRLMKYIINDPSNEEFKGDMIGFVHAMRSAGNNCNIKTKPYRLADMIKDEKASNL